MKKIKLLFTLMLFASFVNATVYYVNISGDNSTGRSWSGAYQTIQSALNASTIGDEIWVAQGTYVIPDVTAQLTFKGGVNVYGGFVGNETSASTRSKNAALTIIKQADTYTTDFRLLNSTDLNDPATWDGFTFDGNNVSLGVRLSGNCTLNNSIVKNCVVTNGSGPGVYMASSSNFIPVTLSNSSIIDNRLKVSSTNTSQLGGAGVYVKIGSALAEIDNCNIKNNTIEGISATGVLEAMGAGVYIVEGAIRNCVLDNNNVTNSASATYSHNNFTGGAIAIVPQNVSIAAKTVLVDGCVITNCTSPSRGGAIIIDPRWSGQYQGNYTISRTIISNCRSTYGVGGGILATAATVQTGTGWTLNVINSVISNNSSASTNAGGGIFINIGCVFNVTNSTIVNNLAGNYAGGGIFMQGTANHIIKATLKNVVLWGNQCTTVRPASDVQISSGGQASTIIFSAIQDYTPTATQFAAATMGDNKALVSSNTDVAGPGFVAPSSAVGYGATDALTANWRLSATSGLIDAGDNYITSDIVNTVRPQGDYSDIGAYEYTTISGLRNDKETLSTIRGTNQAILFNNLDGVKQLNIYNTMGSLVKSVVTTDGENTVRLTGKQVYIVKAGNTVTKVIVY